MALVLSFSLITFSVVIHSFKLIILQQYRYLLSLCVLTHRKMVLTLSPSGICYIGARQPSNTILQFIFSWLVIGSYVILLFSLIYLIVLFKKMFVNVWMVNLGAIVVLCIILCFASSHFSVLSMNNIYFSPILLTNIGFSNEVMRVTGLYSSQAHFTSIK